uniref:Ig-like domain-containing protein n=1 Tax=Erpetoichthys calabaricus TaxID=27687 RepID=A0A8C4SUY6_ERPCA
KKQFSLAFLTLFLFYFPAMLSFRALYIVGLNSTEFPNLTLWEMVDELELYHYDSNNMSFISQYEWLKNIEDQQFWTFQNNLLYYLKDLSNNAIKTVMGLFNQTSGVHFLQGMAGCDINGSSFAVLGYDGNDLLLFNTTSLKCTAAEQEVNVLEDICNIPLISVQFWKQSVLDGYNEGKQQLLVTSVKSEVFLVQRMATEVTCFVTGFLPSEINVTWIRDDGKQVESTSGEILPNGDETYQIRINLTVSSMDLETYSYSCVVKHSSLTKNFIVTWNYKGENKGELVRNWEWK